MATLVSNRPSSYAITSVMIWDQHNSSLLHHEDHLSGVEISIGTKQSRTGCSMSDIAANGMFPVPSGFIQKGLLCGSAGTSIAVSVKGLLENSTNKNASEPFLRNDPRAASRFFYTYLRLIIFLHACRDRRQDLHGRRHGLNPPCRCQAHHLLHHGAAAQVLHQRGHGPRHAGPSLVQGGRPAEPAAGPAPVSSTPTPHCQPPSSLRFPA
jgi:hypothetical protein